MKNFSQRNRFKLAQLLEDKGFGVIPAEFMEGDSFRKEKWQVEGKSLDQTKTGIAAGHKVSIIGWESMGNCIKYGIDIKRNRDYTAIFLYEVELAVSRLSVSGL